MTTPLTEIFSSQRTCGDVEFGELVVYCDKCGRIKGVTRPHGYVNLALRSQSAMKEEQKVAVSQALSKLPRVVRKFIRDSLLALIRRQKDRARR